MADSLALAEKLLKDAATRNAQSGGKGFKLLLLTGFSLAVFCMSLVRPAGQPWVGQETAITMVSPFLRPVRASPSQQLVQPPRPRLHPARADISLAPGQGATVASDEVVSSAPPPPAGAAVAAPPAAPAGSVTITKRSPKVEAREVKLTLTTPMIAGGLVKFGLGRSIANRRVIVVESVFEQGDAWERGMRPGMVVKALTGTNGDERTQMWEVDDKVSLLYFRETIRLARYPIDFVMLEGVQLKFTPQEIAAARADGASEEARSATMTAVDKRIAARKAYNAIDDKRNDFPLVGALGALVLFPPIVILALNSIFHWSEQGASSGLY
jgi:hypothetical protein